MIRLLEITINKYKSFQTNQSIKIDENVTVLVGMNEAGKTVLLEAIAKMNYFDSKDVKFKFDLIQDFPRKELIHFQKSGTKVEIIRAKYEVSKELCSIIEAVGGKGILKNETYESHISWKDQALFISNFEVDFSIFKNHIINKFKGALHVETVNQLEQLEDVSSLKGITFAEGDGAEIRQLFNDILQSDWPDPLSGFVFTTYVVPHQPKYWYFDEYYNLDGRINFNDYKAGKYSIEQKQMIEALLEIAGIQVDDLINTADFESFNAQLEAASAEISEQLFKYWKSNENLEIEFKIDKLIRTEQKEVIVYNPSYPGNIQHATKQAYTDSWPEIVLDIRIKNTNHKITLPLERRSKGFKWFFSFVVWFYRIKNSANSNFILLFDEPGLNLHGLAQDDLLSFLEDLGRSYQVIFTTHSPFMIDSTHLDRIRTILETENGSVALDAIQQKDPNTLFPLQAALGYDIAQNLFISPYNLLVEGPADLLYLLYFSNLLQSAGRTGLDERITVVPVGGLDKVTSFISLLRGSRLQVICLLDTFTDAKGKARLQDLVYHKIIKDKHVRFFDEFVHGYAVAEIEDLFKKEDYLKLFNASFNGKYPNLAIGALDAQIQPIIKQINKAISVDRFNHYTPANKLTQIGWNISDFSDETRKNYEGLFAEINKLFTFSTK